MTFRITDHPIPSRPFSPSSPPDSIRFDPILSIGRNSIEKNGKNPFREDGDNPEANLIPARIERIDIGFTFAFSQCFSAVAACSAASRVCILLVLFLRRYNNDWGRAHGGRACLPTVHRSERSIDFIDNRSLDNGELHTRRFVASDIERTGRFCLPRERERGADASSKQKITSGKREDEGFMTKRRRFAADVATPFRRDRCRGIAFILSQGSIEGGQWRKREGKMKRNARSRALSRRLFRKRWKRIARWGIDGRAIWVNIFYRIVRSPWLLAAAVLPRTGNRNRGRIEESLRSFSIFEKVGRSMENPIYPPG